ncbi:MAG TPA: hypothetical protein DCY75_09020 [Clostridiales bacterium]|nr:hypothetical protein [Clostridiales bacterium]
MIIFILTAFLISKSKKYAIKPVFKAYALYPLFAIELLYWFIQINTFMGNYYFIRFSTYISSAYMVVLFLPIFLYKLYKPALVGSGMVLFGTVLNKIAMYSNGGRMPVYPTLSRLTGYYKEGAINTDTVHILGNSSTKMKVLTDYFNIGWSILSFGDICIHSFVLIMVYYSIKAINQTTRNEVNYA